MKNFFSILAALVILTLFSLLIGNIVLYPLLVFHHQAINGAGILLIMALAVMSIRGFYLHITNLKMRFRKTEDNSQGLPFFVIYLRHMSLQGAKYLVYTLAISLLIVLTAAFFTTNQRLLF